MKLRTCVTAQGEFIFGIHKPSYSVRNLRENDLLQALGSFADGMRHANDANFPAGDVEEKGADWIYEIPNPFPFRGTTYIGKPWADGKAADPESISLPPAKEVSLSDVLGRHLGKDGSRLDSLFATLPQPVLLALAACSTDSADLVRLAGLSCGFEHDPDTGLPTGLRYEKVPGKGARAVILNHDLFETLVNNPHLPDAYKEVMVLRPGAQGGSEIVGETGGPGEAGHVFEYLRRNSYIPWGHYAANMANDAIRYRMDDLGREDMAGLRHLYYQRTFVRLAELLGIAVPAGRRKLAPAELENLRQEILVAIDRGEGLRFDASLWGWNFGFDFAASGYRLHASHQQVHNQFAMVPAAVETEDGAAPLPSYSCGDLIGEFIEQFRKKHGSSFFDSYIKAIRNNQRMDGREDRQKSLAVFEDDNVMLFVPKAQTSQWELQLMTVRPVGNIVEADSPTRQSLDRGILLAMQVLTSMGARMITVIEYAKRFTERQSDQRLLYSFLPRLPQSPGAFSEAELRFILGHFPEDFAAACRKKL